MEHAGARDGKLVSTGKAAKALGVSCNTLRAWADKALVKFKLTPGGQRL